MVAAGRARTVPLDRDRCGALGTDRRGENTQERVEYDICALADVLLDVCSNIDGLYASKAEPIITGCPDVSSKSED